MDDLGYIRITRTRRGDHYHRLQKCEAVAPDGTTIELPISRAVIESQAVEPDKITLTFFRFEEAEQAEAPEPSIPIYDDV